MAKVGVRAAELRVYNLLKDNHSAVMHRGDPRRGTGGLRCDRPMET